MKQTLRRLLILLPSLLVLWPVQTARVAAAEAKSAAKKQCKAAIPVPNPWTKRLPRDWWKKRHEEILSAPGRAESQIVFIGDSITDGWDSEGGGLKIWQKEYVLLKALNLGIVCDSTQHVLWRLDHGEIDNLPKLKVVVVEIGVNNKGIDRHVERDVEKGIIAVCEALKRKAPQAKILLLGVFPRLWGKDNSDRLNRSLAKLEDGQRVFFLNINERLSETEGAIRDGVGHLSEMGYQIWADSMRATLEKLMDPNVRLYPARKALPDESAAPESHAADRHPKAPKGKPRRATAPVMNMVSPRWYTKHFDIMVWQGKFKRRRAEIAFLGSTPTYGWQNRGKAVWEKEYVPLKAYNLGLPRDCTQHVLWRIENATVDGMSKLKLLVLEVGAENKSIHQDEAGDIAAGIEAICERLKAKVPQAKILLIGLFPSHPTGDKYDDVNNIIARLADGKQVFYLNINDALRKIPDTLGKDGNALTEKGYEVWAEQMRPIVKKVMQ